MQVNENILGRHQYILPHAASYRHKLDVIENQLPINPKVDSILTANDVHLYPKHDSVYTELVNSISARDGVFSENITLTNGSDNALKLIAEAYSIPGVKVCIPTPTYPHFISFVQSTYSEIVYVNVTRENMVSSTIKQVIADCLTKNSCNLCYICSPNLPLGYSLDPSEISMLLDKFPNTMFIIDEAYVEYGYVASAANLVLTHNNIIVTRTFSKAYGLAGLRIGYMITAEQNTKQLSVLVNDKNVTALAMRAALTVMKNLPFYIDQVYDTEFLKAYISGELDSITGNSAQIYDFNVAGGNFFLLYARNPALVCDIFARHGVYIRDKSSEIPDAIRIAVGNKRQMEEVLLMVRFINLDYLQGITTMVFDLDNTLRMGSKGDYYKMRKGSRRIVCTNNCTFSPDQLKDEINANGHNVEMVISPLSYFRAAYAGEKPFVVGSVHANQYVGGVSASKSTCVLICGLVFDIEVFAVIRKLYDSGKPVYHTDNGLYTNLDSCSETSLMGLTVVPDIGSLIKLLDIDSKYIGKPELASMLPFRTIFVGDSTATDMQTAQATGSLFVRVGSVDSPRCNLDNLYIELPSVEWL